MSMDVVEIRSCIPRVPGHLIPLIRSTKVEFIGAKRGEEDHVIARVSMKGSELRIEGEKEMVQILRDRHYPSPEKVKELSQFDGEKEIARNLQFGFPVFFPDMRHLFGPQRRNDPYFLDALRAERSAPEGYSATNPPPPYVRIHSRPAGKLWREVVTIGGDPEDKYPVQIDTHYDAKQPWPPGWEYCGSVLDDLHDLQSFFHVIAPRSYVRYLLARTSPLVGPYQILSPITVTNDDEFLQYEAMRKLREAREDLPQTLFVIALHEGRAICLDTSQGTKRDAPVVSHALTPGSPSQVLAPSFTAFLEQEGWRGSDNQPKWSHKEPQHILY